MTSVIVSYQVKPAFVEENIENIQKFLPDFQDLNTGDFQYSVYSKEDNVTFVHYSIYKNEDIQAALLNAPSYKEYHRIRDESGLNGTHQVEILKFIGSYG